MKKYNYTVLCEMKKLPEDVHDFVYEILKPVFDKFPILKPVFDKMLKNAVEKRKFTDKTRALLSHPDNNALPIITFEVHNGVIKQFSFAEIYDQYGYFPNSVRNEQVNFNPKKDHLFKEREDKNGRSRE